MLLAFYGSIIVAVWMTGEVPQAYKDATIEGAQKKKDRTENGNYRGLSLVASTGKVLLKIVGNRFAKFCDEAGIFPEEQCGLRPSRSTTNTMFIVRRLQDLGWASNAQLELFALWIWQKHTPLSIVCCHGKELPVSEFWLGGSRSSTFCTMVCGLAYSWMMETSRRGSMTSKVFGKDVCCCRYYSAFSLRRSS